MQRTLIKDLKPQKSVTLKGHLFGLRDLGKIIFLKLRDRTGEIQIVVELELEKLHGLHPGSVISIEGEVAEQKSGELEIIKPKIQILSKATEPPKVEFHHDSLKENIDTILDNRAIALRHAKYRAIFKIQSVLVEAYREFLTEQGFTEYFGPAMLSSSSEGGAEIFKVPYFKGEATLAQSNQLYKQIMVGVYERVFGLAKWFRAENSNTRRHLTEGMQFEFEMGFIDSMQDVMIMLEKTLRYIIEKAHQKCAKELSQISYQEIKLPESEFPQLTFEQACEIVAKITGEDTSSWDDLTTESERILCEYSRKEFGSDFLFITNFKKGVFYAKKDQEGVYQNFDLLCREAEIISGGQRIHDYEDLKASIIKEGMDLEDFTEYLSIFKQGMPPHGGFGMGLERFTMLFLGLENIRDASLFPSDPKRIASQRIQN